MTIFVYHDIENPKKTGKGKRKKKNAYGFFVVDYVLIRKKI